MKIQRTGTQSYRYTLNNILSHKFGPLLLYVILFAIIYLIKHYSFSIICPDILILSIGAVCHIIRHYISSKASFLFNNLSRHNICLHCCFITYFPGYEIFHLYNIELKLIQITTATRKIFIPFDI